MSTGGSQTEYPSGREHGNHGQNKFKDSEFVEAVEKLDPAVASSISEYVGCSVRTVHTRMAELEEDGIVNRREVTSTVFEWNLSDE